MTALEQLLHRRSIRSYKPELPERSLIEQITEAGTYAACGKNLQSGIIVAVTNKELRDRISAMNNKIWGGEEGFDPFYGAPAILIVLAKKDSPHKIYDGSLIMGNMMLAADALGLGTCWIHRAKEEFETEEGKQILRDLGITEEYEGIGHLVVRYVGRLVCRSAADGGADADEAALRRFSAGQRPAFSRSGVFCG